MIKKLFKKHKKKKIFLFVLSFFIIFWFWPNYNKNINYGATFSAKYARELGVNPQEVLEKTFTDLKIKKIRLVLYWDDFEKIHNKHDFSDLDWQIDMAKKYDAEVILAIGKRVPRWPECHLPIWTEKMSWEEQKKEIRELITLTINRYDSYPNIKKWQIENEPFLTEYARKYCGKYLDKEFLKEEIDLVKSLSEKPILITDSGELSTWNDAYKTGDAFGSTMYLYVGNDFFDDMRVPLTPNYYNWRLNIAGLLHGKKENILAELSIEPWLLQPIIETPIDIQLERMSIKRAKTIIDYASRTKFNDQYLWGVEWWYYLKERNHPEIWDYIKSLTNK